jgi:glycosyltransferase involved in cell wall biosynthesis
MGAWLDRITTTPEDGFRSRRIVFLGHLVPRQGVELLLEALALLRKRGEQVDATVIGTGPTEQALRDSARAQGVDISFTGFVDDHREVERLLAEGSLAVAPYRPTADSFTRYADPGKLKAYLAAGLPVVLTDVPPNARELALEAGAELVPYDANALAEALARGLADESAWRQRRRRALTYARRFDWDRLLKEALGKLELTPVA